MSHKKMKTKIATGAAVVALSGFVPAAPMVQNAHAAATSINVSGSFSAGISITSTAAVDIGTIIATAITGTANVDAGGNAGAVGGTVVAGSSKGLVKGNFAVNKAIDIIVSGFGTLAGLNATLDKVYFDNVAGPGTITGGAATTTASVLATAITGTGNKSLDLGAGVSWTGAFPATGAFTKAINITLQY